MDGESRYGFGFAFVFRFGYVGVEVELVFVDFFEEMFREEGLIG